ncbi:MAG: hypothetical protein QF864_16260 [SAR202 cluster bacterium]|jgi:hypothetical protein|nr:hypothetical protein [SAR202 cluster bacterium]|tara:strand:- start:221 stop:838 length:618 start_codon:yes stop_codon:yes gene_type:complete
MKIQTLRLWLGMIFLFVGILLAVVYNWGHYYTFFSIGAFLILLEVYRQISGKEVFEGWNILNHFVFWGLLTIASLFIDSFGVDAGYWVYPHYFTLTDEVFKIFFEWVVPLAYLMITLMIGINILNKKYSLRTSTLLSLLSLVIITGFVTEFINNFANSWRILKMPLSSFEIRGYFLVFQTFGYWALAAIPYLIYNLVLKFRRDEK